MQGEVVENQGTASTNMGSRSEKVKNDHLQELEKEGAPPLQEQGGDDKKRKHEQVEEPELPSGPFLGDNQALKRCKQEFAHNTMADLVTDTNDRQVADGQACANVRVSVGSPVELVTLPGFSKDMVRKTVGNANPKPAPKKKHTIDGETWVQKFDPTSKRNYYFVRGDNKMTTWTPPKGWGTRRGSRSLIAACDIGSGAGSSTVQHLGTI